MFWSTYHVKAWCHELVRPVINLTPIPQRNFDRIRNSMNLCNALVHNIFSRLQWNFVHNRTVTLLWIVQNFVVIGWSHFKPQHSKFWSNFEFDWNTDSGTCARSVILYGCHEVTMSLNLIISKCTHHTMYNGSWWVRDKLRHLRWISVRVFTVCLNTVLGITKILPRYQLLNAILQ